MSTNIIRITDKTKRNESKDSRLMRQYGIDSAEFERIASEQNYCCAICDGAFTLVVDHNHQTGVVRGLLCQACNRGLGVFQDDPSILRKAADYLAKRV